MVDELPISGAMFHGTTTGFDETHSYFGSGRYARRMERETMEYERSTPGVAHYRARELSARKRIATSAAEGMPEKPDGQKTIRAPEFSWDDAPASIKTIF